MKSRSRKFVVILGVLALFAVVGLAYFWSRSFIFDSAAAALKIGNYAEAAPKLKVVALMGDSKAQTLMGDLYALGWGVPKNDDEAIVWYRRAGSLGEDANDPAAPAMYYIGRKYLGGEGVPRNEAEARKWLERSARGGYKKAAEQLAQMPTSSR